MVREFTPSALMGGSEAGEAFNPSLTRMPRSPAGGIFQVREGEPAPVGWGGAASDALTAVPT